MSNGIIYKITNLINGKSYIGQTRNERPHRRIQCHFRKQKAKDLVYLACLKYGKENLKAEIICSSLNATNLNDLERILVEQETSLVPNGYNMKTGGNQGGGYSPELSEEVSQKVKEWYQANDHPFKGKKFSESHRANLSKVRKGFTSEARQAARAKQGIQRRIKLKAIHLTTQKVQYFDSIEACAQELNLVPTCISRVLRGDQNRKQHNGYSFQKV